MNAALVCFVASVVLAVVLAYLDRHEYQRVYFGIIEALADGPKTTLELNRLLGWRIYWTLADLDDAGHVEPDDQEAYRRWRLR
jgi:hypothetical protein